MYQAIIDKYYSNNPELRDVLLVHSEKVTQKALSAAHKHPELHLNENFIIEAAMLHDIGIFLCDATSIHCYGSEPYVCHGRLGAQLLRREGYPKHARVAERHTGTGLTAEIITKQQLPLPPQDYTPETIEEQIICWADKFFSKSHPDREKTTEQVIKMLSKFPDADIDTFKKWQQMFG